MPVMSPDDHARWQAVQEWKAERLAPEVSTTSWWERVSGVATSTAAGTLGRLPGATRIGDAALAGLEALIDLGAGTAAATVRTDGIVEAVRRHGHAVADLDDVRALPLADLDAATPRLDVPYAVGGAAATVGTGLLTSAAAAVTVSAGAATSGVAVAPGLGAVALALALDATVGVLVSQRAVAHVAAYHGYDVTDPQERLFALGVLSLGLAQDSRRAAAYQELDGIARSAARQQAWRQLSSAEITAVVRTVTARLATQVTQQRIAEVVPVLGTVLAVRRTARTLTQLVDDAQHLYTERLLRERYDLPLAPEDPATRETSTITDALDADLALR